MDMNFKDGVKLINEIIDTKALSIQEALSNLYFKNELEFRLGANFKEDEAFDIDYGQKREYEKNYIDEIMTKYSLEDFVNWDKLDDAIQKIVDKINNDLG